MKTTKEKRKNQKLSPEEAVKQLQKLFKERGSKALEMARKEILQEKIECKEAKEALTYFMTEYWNDLVRPTLLSLACEAVGGKPEQTTPIAVPLILISGAIDVHDDIIDQSKIKNEKTTVYGKYGREIALLVGDALLFKGLTLLNQAQEKGIPAQLMPEILITIKNTFFELGDAEALELRFRGRTNVSPEEYLDVVRKKAADVEAYAHISATVGGGSRVQIEALSRFGRLLGMIAVLKDDLVDVAEPEEVLHRIKKECLPIPLLYALQDPKTSEKIKALLGRKVLRKRDAETILRLTYEAGGFKSLEMLIKRLIKEAAMSLTTMQRTEELKLLLYSSLLPFKQLEEFFSK
jgi:geranylgeranyl pyrophosphate synthase